MAKRLFIARKSLARLARRKRRGRRDGQGVSEALQPEPPATTSCVESACYDAPSRQPLGAAVERSTALHEEGLSASAEAGGYRNKRATRIVQGEEEEQKGEEKRGEDEEHRGRQQPRGPGEWEGRQQARGTGEQRWGAGAQHSAEQGQTGAQLESQQPVGPGVGSDSHPGSQEPRIRAEGYPPWYWPTHIPKAIGSVINGRVCPPAVPYCAGWEVPDPPAWPECMIKPQAWAALLADYPDRGLISMLREGCATGYAGPCVPIYTANSASCFKLADVVEAKLAKEAAAGQVEPCAAGELLMVSPFAFIPKGDGGKRMIRNLSAPVVREGEAPTSVNANIPDDSLPPLALVTIEDFITLAGQWRAAGCRDLHMLRVDASDAYRRMPIRPCDRWQLGMEWSQQRWRDAALPMGLKSSCHLFQRWTLAFNWWLARQGITGGGYLDDTVLLGPAGQVDGWGNTTRDTMDQGGMQHSAKKRLEDGPAAPAAVALGYWLDLGNSTVSLTEEKRARLMKQLRRLIRATCVRRCDLSQLVGWLGHALRVVPHLKCFMGGLYHHPGAFAARTDRRWVRLQPAAKESCRRWLAWLRRGQATRMFSLWGCVRKAVTVYTDASLWGGACWSPQLGCLWWRWRDVLPGLTLTINVLEAITLVAMLHYWRPQVEGAPLRVRTDNTAALGAIRRGHSGNSPRLQAAVMRWGEEVSWLGGELCVHLDWVASEANLFADACSRDPLGVSQADRKAAPWRRMLEESSQPPQCVKRPDSWWHSWMARLEC